MVANRVLGIESSQEPADIIDGLEASAFTGVFQNAVIRRMTGLDPYLSDGQTSGMVASLVFEPVVVEGFESGLVDLYPRVGVPLIGSAMDIGKLAIARG